MDQDKEQPAAELHEEPAQAEEPKPGPAAAKKTSPKKKPAAPAPAVTPGGTRERKKVEHFKPAEVSETKRLVVKEVRQWCPACIACGMTNSYAAGFRVSEQLGVVPQGKGTKLRDIPNGEQTFKAERKVP